MAVVDAISANQRYQRPASSVIPVLRIAIASVTLILGALMVQAQTTNRVCLAWEPSLSPDITGYRLYVGTTSGQYPTWFDLGNVTNSCVTNVEEGVTLYFVVTSKDASGLESEPTYEIACSIPFGGRFPTISAIPDRVINRNAILGPVDFSIGDDLTPPASLTVTATSTNVALVPDANIMLSGSGSNRTLVAWPVTDAFGTTLITMRVTDSQAGFSTVSFLLTVNPVEGPSRPKPPTHFTCRS